MALQLYKKMAHSWLTQYWQRIGGDLEGLDIVKTPAVGISKLQLFYYPLLKLGMLALRGGSC